MGDPTTDERLWWYKELWKFEYLIANARLWFSSPQKLLDQSEGDLGLDAPAVTEWWRTIRVPELRPDPNWTQKYIDAWNAVNASVTGEGISADYRKSTLVSCWSQCDAESLRMWDEYADGSGVAVVSSLDRLEEALGHWENDDVLAWRGRVRYGASLADVEPDYRRVGPVSVGFFKRPCYAWEQELRVATLDRNAAKIDGKGLPVDLAALIGEIVISPRADQSRIEEVERLVHRLRPALVSRIRVSTLLSVQD